jgi:Thiamine pyrophosphate enzyme, N-terminal TPP binding domain
MKVFQAISDAVKSEGVQVTFALMGDANQNLIVDLGQRHGVKIVNFRHEQNAVAAADGYARFSDGKLGLALVTTGPGLTNTATSLVAARVHRSPVLVFAGATSVGELHSPQRFDQVAISQLLAGAGAVLESPGSLAVQLDLAFGRVRRQSGPFVLNLPGNIQNAAAPEDWSYRPGYSDTNQPFRLAVHSAPPRAFWPRLAVRRFSRDAVRYAAEQLLRSPSWRAIYKRRSRPPCPPKASVRIIRFGSVSVAAWGKAWRYPASPRAMFCLSSALASINGQPIMAT